MSSTVTRREPKTPGSARAPTVTVIVVPNVSEGRDERKIGELAATIGTEGARVLDVHSDGVHNRSVFTVAGSSHAIVPAMAALADASRYIDLGRHRGAHPRLGGLDVCPVVAHDLELSNAVHIAKEMAAAIAARAELPVYLYGAAATRESTRELPSLRRGGLEALKRRAAGGLTPDFGPSVIDLRAGVVCVGARAVLIAFNVWLKCDVAIARSIAAIVRTSGGGPPGVRAIGLAMGSDVSQVSINLTDPAATGIDKVFQAVLLAASEKGASVVATEIVGLPPAAFRPDPSGEAARLLSEPGRSLESALSR